MIEPKEDVDIIKTDTGFCTVEYIKDPKDPTIRVGWTIWEYIEIPASIREQYAIYNLCKKESEKEDASIY